MAIVQNWTTLKFIIYISFVVAILSQIFNVLCNQVLKPKSDYQCDLSVSSCFTFVYVYACHYVLSVIRFIVCVVFRKRHPKPVQIRLIQIKLKLQIK